VLERRIVLDLDERGDVISWSVTNFDATGHQVFCHVCPVAPEGDSDAFEVLNNLRGMEPDIQLALPVSWERWLNDALKPEGETPMSARNDRQR